MNEHACCRWWVVLYVVPGTRIIILIVKRVFLYFFISSFVFAYFLTYVHDCGNTAYEY